MSKEIRVQEISLPEQQQFTLVDATEVSGITVEKEVDPLGEIYSDGVQNPPLLFKDMFKGQSGEVFWSYPDRTAGWSMAVQSVGYLASHELALGCGLDRLSAEIIASQPYDVAARLVVQAVKLYSDYTDSTDISIQKRTFDINTYKIFDPLELNSDREGKKLPSELSLSSDPLEKRLRDEDPFAKYRPIIDPFEEKRRDEDPFAKIRDIDDPFKIPLRDEDPFAKYRPIIDPFEEKRRDEDPFAKYRPIEYPLKGFLQKNPKIEKKNKYDE